MAAVAAEARDGSLRTPGESAPTLAALFEEWIERRMATHRTWRDDLSRWRKHFTTPFGRPEHSALADCRVDAVGEGDLRAFVAAKRVARVSPSTVGHCMRLLSRLFSYAVLNGPRTGVTANPLRTLDKSVRRLYKPASGARTVPFIERADDVPRLVETLTQPYSVMFAVATYAGLRPGEVKALAWPDIDLEGRSISVSRQVVRGALRSLSTAGRAVPMPDPLVPILTSWRAACSGDGFAFPSVVRSRGGRSQAADPLVTNDHTLLVHLDRAQATLGLRRLTWYQATRHTFASRWALAGGSLEELARILGQSPAWIRARYGHLQADTRRGEGRGPGPDAASDGQALGLCDLPDGEREKIRML